LERKINVKTNNFKNQGAYFHFSDGVKSLQLALLVTPEVLLVPILWVTFWEEKSMSKL